MGTLTDVQGNINAQKYLEIIDNNIWPVIVRHFPYDEYVFMDNNAPVHRAKIVKDYTTENNVNTRVAGTIPWLDIIENIWLRIKRELETTFIHTKQDLMAEIRTIWENTPLDCVHEFYRSIPVTISD